MKRVSRFLGVFLCLLVLSVAFFTVSASATADTVIDTATASEGYFTVNYSTNAPVKMKVGVTYNNSTVYYNYTPGAEASYTFTKGDGNYTVTLYRNVSGTSYRKVTSAQAVVKMEDALSPYCVSTAEITFSQDDAVGKKAAELCAGITDDSAKAVAIHNYIAANFVYDYDFAANVRSGAVKNYVPNTNGILSAQKGVCYDFSALYAAMCRSQGIPCTVEKGYLDGKYHAWNKVHIDDTWEFVDLTASVCRKISSVERFSDCTVSMNAGSGYTY